MRAAAACRADHWAGRRRSPARRPARFRSLCRSSNLRIGAWVIPWMTNGLRPRPRSPPRRGRLGATPRTRARGRRGGHRRLRARGLCADARRASRTWRGGPRTARLARARSRQPAPRVAEVVRGRLEGAHADLPSRGVVNRVLRAHLETLRCCRDRRPRGTTSCARSGAARFMWPRPGAAPLAFEASRVVTDSELTRAEPAPLQSAGGGLGLFGPQPSGSVRRCPSPPQPPLTGPRWPSARQHSERTHTRRTRHCPRPRHSPDHQRNSGSELHSFEDLSPRPTDLAPLEADRATDHAEGGVLGQPVDRPPIAARRRA